MNTWNIALLNVLYYSQNCLMSSSTLVYIQSSGVSALLSRYTKIMVIVVARGITILSCLGKLFSNLLNDRLTQFVEKNRIIGPEQAGFRPGFSTTDHMFCLKALIDIYLSKKKKLYCCYIDYSKAFDSVVRTELWHKMLNCNMSNFYK